MANEKFNADARRLDSAGNKCAKRLKDGKNRDWKRLTNYPVPERKDFGIVPPPED